MENVRRTSECLCTTTVDNSSRCVNALIIISTWPGFFGIPTLWMRICLNASLKVEDSTAPCVQLGRSQALFFSGASSALTLRSPLCRAESEGRISVGMLPFTGVSLTIELVCVQISDAFGRVCALAADRVYDAARTYAQHERPAHEVAGQLLLHCRATSTRMQEDPDDRAHS